ncbi:heavy metal-associated isoprenylated plant protein 41-like [Lycium ferocissimum]|uniref:heavy metal-associated isoprenylated plant protein 41-like n=1 Tax=Lycium ferocissimum TaxID=112874 RepID=UPI0028168467|nr:heavy metal-associated isoprenylated plant protein 41-like [Lycium ferocissimum]
MAENSPLKVINQEDEEEKRIQHYSSYHQILLVGEGDFSFSLCLAHSFGNASNIFASSLRSYDDVIKMYKNGESNLEKLKSLGGSILHGVNATKMQHHPDLSNQKFDRIIFNFPHAGFHGSEDNKHLIQMHRNLVRSFLWSAKKMLSVGGQIHVAHKTTPTYNRWDLVGLGKENSLICIECAEFRAENYPGYNNKMGDGPKCDEPFHLGECQTFMFILDLSRKNVPMTKQKKHNLHEPSRKNVPMTKQKKRNSHKPSQKLQKVPKHNLHAPPQKFQKVPNSISPPIYSFQQQPSWIDRRNSPTYVSDKNGCPSLPARHDNKSECVRIFKPYFSYIQENFGREEIGVEVSVRQALQHASLMYRAETERPPEAYLKLLKELRFLSQSRISRLRQKLQNPDRRLW